jgi:hypothetical protein
VATLVFSTVGTVLGGPLGGAIGALIGQSIDQTFLAPAPRGPRLGDLSVQTSSYGTQIPRIYGTMRVAGSIVWATDLVESAATAGAKGQPDTVFSYAVSFAVALSSRRASSIGRIWADGKLLRGAEGDFKVSTGFRFYEGSEDQPIDPLIGSAEGLANTPAYRGLALAVFENLELAEYGNRIPFLTFEVTADEPAASLETILGDASAGAIVSDAQGTMAGYAAYGPSVKSSVEPLISSFGVDLFDDGSIVRTPLAGVPGQAGESDFGNSSTGEQMPRLQRDQAPAHSLPGALRMTYYDPARDYQAGQVRAAAGDVPGIETERELAAVLDSAAAKSLVHQNLARAWAERDRVTLRLPPRFLQLEPGSRLDLPLIPRRWTVDRCTIEGMVVVAELRPSWTPIPTIPAEPGRIAEIADVVAAELTLALFDAPNVLDPLSSVPTLLLAASNESPGWRSRAVEIRSGGQSTTVPTAARKSVLGRTLDQLARAETDLIDLGSSVEVELVDRSQWLVSCDDEALANGANMAIIGDEVIQFGEALSTGPGRFRLGRLLRGRAGTEWAAEGHATGENFLLVEGSTVRAVALPPWMPGATVTASVAGGDGAGPSLVAANRSLRPLAPVRVRAEAAEDGALNVRWIRRSRQGLAWIDGIDVPLGETREEYRVTITGSAGTIEIATTAPEANLPADGLTVVGAGVALIEVRQAGDWGLSPAARCTIIL